MIESIYFSLIFIVYWLYVSSYSKLNKINLLFLLIVGAVINGLCFFYDISYVSILFNLMLMVFYYFIVLKNKLNMGIVLFLMIFLMNYSLFFILTVFEISEPLLITYNTSLLIVFLLIHNVKNKVSYSYYVLYIFFLIICTYLSMTFYLDAIYFNYVLVTLGFLIANSNQKYIRLNYDQTVNEYQNKVIEQHVEEVEHIYETMRGWRHDYHNHMQTLKAHLSLKKYALMEDYLNDLEKDLDHIHTIVESNNTYLDAMLNSKLSLALSKEIDINIKAKVPNKLLVSNIDLCVVIGNLLDNAIESCEAMNDDSKFIRVYIGVFKKQLYISVTNSTKELVRKLDSEYISNKRGNHGHGLKRIDLVVKKYEGFINRKNEPGVFATEIMLPL